MLRNRRRSSTALASTCARALAVALALGSCAEGGVRLPRLRVRGWVTISASDRSAAAGGELGLVMPLDSAPARGGRDETVEPDAASASDEAGPAMAGRNAPCRVPLACRWESVERARALARNREEGGER